MLAPREIGQEGFREGKVVETALKTLLEVGKELESKIAVFVSPPELAHNRANKAAVKDFLTSVRKKFDRVIWEAPLTWDADEAAALAADVKVIAARDPLAARPHDGARRVLPPRRPRGPQEPLRGPGDREARRARQGREAQGRDVRVHERRHVRRREALQEGDEAPVEGRAAKEKRGDPRRTAPLSVSARTAARRLASASSHAHWQLGVRPCPSRTSRSRRTRPGRPPARRGRTRVWHVAILLRRSRACRPPSRAERRCTSEYLLQSSVAPPASWRRRRC